MITTLTEKQEKGITEWRQHCLEIGRDTSPINKEVVEKSWTEFYKILKKKKPLFWYCQSPLQAQIIINIFPEITKVFKISDKGANIGDNIGDNIRANIWDNIWDNIGANIRDNIGDNIGVNIGDNIENNIWDNIGDNIRANIWDNIWDNIGANIRDNIGDNIGVNIGDNIRANIGGNIENNIWDNIGANIGANIGVNIGDNIGANIGANIKKLNFNFIETYSWCQHDINWIGYYKYFEKYKLLPYDDNFKIFDIWYDLACSCGWCYTFENIVFICEKPCKLFLNNRGQLHKEDDMALEYSDGYGLYMLNGVRVPKEIIVTPAEKLNPELLIKETNAEVRREIIRKIGINKILQKLQAKKLSTWREYELYRIDNIDIEPVHILKMICPSRDLIYAIRVPPEIHEAYDARVWISNGKKPEEFLIET